jgi:hypothetical protein
MNKVNWPLMIAFAFGLAAGHYWRASRSLRIETFRLRDSLNGYVVENKKLNAEVKALHAALQLPPPLEDKEIGPSTLTDATAAHKKFV